MKKADPQAVQRGRLFRAALFARFSVWFRFYGVRLYRRAKRADLYNTSARRSAILVFISNKRLDILLILCYNN